MADNLTVETVKMSVGETKQVAIVLNNPTRKYAAFQFDLVLPEGISVAKNDKGKFIASLNEDRIDDHTLNVSETGTNTYRFLSFSMTNTELYGTNGALVYVTLQASDGISEGNKTATIQSQVFTEVSGEQYKWADKTFQITIGAVGSKGDVNGDGAVDIADAVCIVNHIVGKANSTFVEAAADVNGDGVVDIADAVKIVNLVVGKVETLSRKSLEVR